ncbi:MAG TPA: PAS domain S-box protein, partial [Terracidiphilus sp.]|nr:PAS domain S-box protein [Terracidiphilus sp.]
MRWDARKASVHALESLAVMVMYFVAARIGLAVPFTHGNVSPLWPPAGIALGAILIFGPHVCLGIAAGAFLANFFTPIPHLAALVLGVGNTLGPAVAASLLQGKLVAPIQRLRDVLNLILFGSLGTAISALIGSSTLFLAGVNTGGRLAETFAVWCFGDLMGVFLTTPLFLNFADFKLPRPRLVELGLLMTSLLAASEFLFRENTIAGAVFGLLLLPFVLWGAARFSIGGATLSCLVASIFAVWATGRGIGPFLPYGTSVHHVHALQMFIAALSLSGLCLAAVIAERTKAEAALAREEKLRRAQEQYRTIIETTNDGVWMIDSNFRTTFVNRRMAELLGYTPEEMLGRTPFDFMFLEDIPGERADFELRLKGVGEIFYTRYRRKDGPELWALVSSAPLPSAEGTFAGALTMQNDVTSLRRAEEALRASEELFRGVFEISPLGLALIQPDYRLAKVNASLCRMSGFLEAELLGRNPFDLTHPEDLQKSMALAQRLFNGEIPSYQIEKRYVKKSGEIMWATMTATLLRDRQGQPLLGLGMTEDITERKRVQEALRQSEERLRSLIEQAPIGITLVNRDHRLLNVNAAFCQMLGYSEAELKRMTALDVTHADDRQPTIDLTERLFTSAIPMRKQEKRYVRKTGE